ncbi:MAG: hypothetical protein GY936_02990 [Ignavibacteriae bacterium]|nr:hypothetical protein [Ignavibacteriota bacterium]
MIVILKYSNNNEQEFSEIFKKLKLEYTFTLDESIIIKASHIILPDTNNLNKAVRKMQLMNLYSVLRMIKKPILGINNGFNLMCNNLTDIQKLGLGLFPIDSETCSSKNEVSNNIGKINVLKKTNILEQINIKSINCNLDRPIDVNDFTTSVILNNNQEYSLTCENQNYYSIQIEISKNKELFEKLIGNFVKL